MKLLLIGSDLLTPQFRAACAAENCELQTMTSREFCTLSENIEFSADAALVSRDHGHHDPLPHIRGLSRLSFTAAIRCEQDGIANVSPEDNALCNSYVLYGGEENLRRLIRLIRHRIYGSPKPAEPEELPFDSIFTMDGKLYSDTRSYMEQEESGYEHYIGLLNYRTRWQANDLAVESALKAALNRRGIGVIPLFSNGTPDPGVGALSMEAAIRKFYTEDGKPLIDLLVNFIFFGIAEGADQAMFSRTARFYEELDLPVVRPVLSSYLNNEQWEQSAAPFSTDAALNFDVAEMQGMIEPLFLGGSKDRRTREVVVERAERLAGRIASWIRLRKCSNHQKKLAVFLNSAVCSGVEATLGRASGLDSFSSVLELLHRLKEEDYDVGTLPESGENLRQLFLEKKAYSDFRWTSAEDIAACGGTLYTMPSGEYEKLYHMIPQSAREAVEKTWGPAPGEAMVLDGKILITGLRLGNVLLLIQPKRGCFGAKCSGEVCKILQDPACPPTHQYLATYFYAHTVFGADALIHVGTHGSLEFLPGKASGLSSACFPDICIGEKPNLYIYNMASIGPAMLAKRRSYAVLSDHVMEKEKLHLLDERELRSVLNGLEGRFIPPGEGGEKEDLPAGRNLYGVQIGKIPTSTAYERGAQAAEEMAQRFLEEEGHYPEQIALNMVSLDIPRTGGEQLSLFLRLIGLRPVWDQYGTVERMECIPLEELKRPRLDVSIHISSVLRDAWPDIIAKMDEAVLLAAAQDERPEDNFIVKNTLGKTDSVARIFGAAPGTYSNSIGLALKASAWKNDKDLGRYFVDSSSYVYGKNRMGQQDLHAFLETIKRTEATCDVISMKHSDAIRSSYSSRVQGGYALAAKMLGVKRNVRSFMGESGQQGVAVKTMKEHLEDGVKSTLFNEEWKQRQLDLGYDGAAEIMCRLQNIFEMQCVNENFSSETLDRLAKDYIMDEEVRHFMEKNNPYAAEESARRFLELNSRGKWKPDPAILIQLQKDYLKTEANLEDGISGRGEIQGGSVEIVADEAVDSWKKRLAAADQEIERWKKQNF